VGGTAGHRPSAAGSQHAVALEELRSEMIKSQSRSGADRQQWEAAHAAAIDELKSQHAKEVQDLQRRRALSWLRHSRGPPIVGRGRGIAD